MDLVTMTRIAVFDWTVKMELDRKRMGLALALCAGLAGGTATRAAAADAAHGAAIAQRWCASCHVVASNQTSGTAGVPSFSEIASRETFDAARVALFLLAPHPKMPDMNLTRVEAADLAAYIAQQKK